MEIIDSLELARRWHVPESWVRTYVGNRVPKQDRIPCVRFGKYVRFEWDSPELQAWIAKRREGGRG